MIIADNARAVLERRYFKKDEDGNIIEGWHDMIKRVSDNVANGDKEKAKRFYDLLNSGAFLPNSPTLMNAGGDLQQLAACFVLPIEDSMESIFEAIKNAALIHKSGGGTGFSFSRLREANARVRSTNGVSSGPISFMKVFNAATESVKQGGARRGANMAILSVDHPQILEFIKCKEDPTEMTNFNISVAITDEFMEAMENDEMYNLISPHTQEVAGQLSAVEVYNLIVEMAHKNGEPGIIFIDRINEYNTVPGLGRIEATNPCGEQVLLGNEACNLGSINVLHAFCVNGVDYEKLNHIVHDAVEFLDMVIDVSEYPIDEIAEMTRANRKIGLGIMGWADLLYKLKIPYASEEAVTLAKKVMRKIKLAATIKSVRLAVDHGSFPNIDKSIYAPGYEDDVERNISFDTAKKNGIRNATLTTIAPTGSISMIADVSSGIEPQFSLVYTKTVMDDDKFLYVNKHFEEALKKEGIYSQELLEEVARRGSIADMEGIPAHIREVFQTAHDISPEWHVKMQAAFQEYTDNAVSKTINFPNDATIEDVDEAYRLAYKLGCKGITVYRDGSRDNQVLSVGTVEDEPEVLCGDDAKVAPRSRPEVTRGTTQRVETGCGYMYVTINEDDHGVCEVFIQMGKAGGCASSQLESIARLLSLAFRSGVGVDPIIRQLKGIHCQSPMWHKGRLITSCGDAVAFALESFAKDGDKEIKAIHIDVGETTTSMCPDCGSSIEHLEGCLSCMSCGWSKC